MSSSNLKVLPCVQPVFWDVDDTLVMWGVAKENDPGAIKITCPASRFASAFDKSDPNTEFLISEQGEWSEWLLPHAKHVEQLKLHKLRGHTTIVWSAGGWEWALAAVKALKIEQYVDLVIEKPKWYYDDKSSEEFMGKPNYLKNE